MTGRLRIQLFGGLSAKVGDRVVTRFSTQKTACLLAYLAYYLDRRHPREVLIEMLWPDADLDSGRNRLSTALSSLRRQLEPPGVPSGSVIQADRYSVQLNHAAIATDVREFLAALRAAKGAVDAVARRSSLQRAQRIYAGDLLQGFYEDWIVEEQRRLAHMRDTARAALRQLGESESPPTPAVQPSAAAAVNRPADRETVLLPVRFTRFFGRQEEIAWLEKALLDPYIRLVTLTGFAGAGKSRTAIEVSARIAGAFPGFVAFVPLAALGEAGLIGSAILQALSIPPTPAREPLAHAASALSAARSLLILDNAEHLAGDGAAIVQQLLDLAPNLKVLVTSRRILNLSAEHEFPLGPLALPSIEGSIEECAQYDCVRLFLDRAQHVRPDFQLKPSNSAAIAQICERLDGIPLALELAAARAQVLTAPQIRDHLDRRLEFLVSRRAGVGDRHRSLKAAIDWSFGMLPPDLQSFFCKLSVFRGGWTLDAAREVCEEPNALEFLEQLHEASLVLVEETEIGIRFRMLETFREYGWERLHEKERDALSLRYLTYFLTVAADCDSQLRGKHRAAWICSLDAEYANIASVLQWAIGRPAVALCDNGGALRLAAPARDYGLTWDARLAASEHLASCAHSDAVTAGDAALLLCCALQEYCGPRIRPAEMARMFSEALAVANPETPVGIRAQTLGAAGSVHYGMGQHAAALPLYQESLRLRREQGDPLGIARALNNVGNLVEEMGELVAARAALEEALTIHRSIDNEHGEAIVLTNLGNISLRESHFTAARELFDAAGRIDESLGYEKGILHMHHNLGSVAFLEADFSEACRQFRACLVLCRRIDDRHMAALSLENLARTEAALSRHRRAARLIGAASSLLCELSVSLYPAAQQDRTELTAKLSDELGASEYATEVQTGEAMSWEDAIEYALESAPQ